VVLENGDKLYDRDIASNVKNVELMSVGALNVYDSRHYVNFDIVTLSFCLEKKPTLQGRK
jgi:hypothetical protein